VVEDSRPERGRVVFKLMVELIAKVPKLIPYLVTIIHVQFGPLGKIGVHALLLAEEVQSNV